ncbi:MAG TPA: type II secretion system protein [Telluria sp.]|jgi:type II secretory pathway pseudopilin PulG
MPIIERGRRAPAQRGFAYLWVLLLIAIMGVGLTVAAEIDATAGRREREKQLLAIGRQFQTALARYHQIPTANGLKEYPSTIDELLQDPRAPGIRRHLRKRFVDPMTGKAEWGLVLMGGRIVGIHSLSEQTPIKQDGFEPEHMALRGKQKYTDWQFVYPPDLMLAPSGETAAADQVLPPTEEPKP